MTRLLLAFMISVLVFAGVGAAAPITQIVANHTAWCFNTTTLLQNTQTWNGALHENETVYENCRYGCDKTTDTCRSVEDFSFQQNIMIGFAIIIGGLLAACAVLSSDKNPYLKLLLLGAALVFMYGVLVQLGISASDFTALSKVSESIGSISVLFSILVVFVIFYFVIMLLYNAYKGRNTLEEDDNGD